MKAILTKIGNVVFRILGRRKTALPVGMTEFEKWANSIISIYKPPGSDDSVKFALATMIMHSGPTEAYKSKHYFNLALRASAAKQISGAVFQDIKLRQQKAAKDAQEALAKPPEVVVANVT